MSAFVTSQDAAEISWPQAHIDPLPSPPFGGYTGRYGGHVGMIPVPPLFRGTSFQEAGLYMFSVGAQVPQVGTPLGPHLITGETVCADPIAMFMDGRIGNPSQMALGLPHMGKSSLIVRQLIGGAYRGVIPMIFGDLKPDYVDLIRALDGQVISLGRGLGSINPLDARAAYDAASKLPDVLADELIQDAAARRVALICSLISVMRRREPNEIEANLIAGCIDEFDEQHNSAPLVGQMLDLLRHPTERLRELALDRGDNMVYQETTKGLEASLMALAGRGRFGSVFAQQTSEMMRFDQPVVFDVSAIPESDKDMQAAALLTCWTNGFSTINAANALMDAGIEQQRFYHIVQDEFHRPMQAGPGVIRQYDSITRLNRSVGVANTSATHTMQDLESMPDEADKALARGFAERAGMLMLFAFPFAEMSRLQMITRLSGAEQNLLTSFAASRAYGETHHYGLGKALMKTDKDTPGIPFQLNVTKEEVALHDTNRKWHTSQVQQPHSQDH